MSYTAFRVETQQPVFSGVLTRGYGYLSAVIVSNAEHLNVDAFGCLPMPETHWHDALTPAARLTGFRANRS